jgi:DNA-binding transcriptional regulator YiaG
MDAMHTADLLSTAELLKLAEARRLAQSGEGRAVRLAAGMSCDQIGGAIGVSGVAISRWETGQRKPSGEPALKYVDVIGGLSKVVAQ